MMWSPLAGLSILANFDNCAAAADFPVDGALVHVKDDFPVDSSSDFAASCSCCPCGENQPNHDAINNGFFRTQVETRPTTTQPTGHGRRVKNPKTTHKESRHRDGHHKRHKHSKRDDYGTFWKDNNHPRPGRPERVVATRRPSKRADVPKPSGKNNNEPTGVTAIDWEAVRNQRAVDVEALDSQFRSLTTRTDQQIARPLERSNSAPSRPRRPAWEDVHVPREARRSRNNECAACRRPLPVTYTHFRRCTDPECRQKQDEAQVKAAMRYCELEQLWDLAHPPQSIDVPFPAGEIVPRRRVPQIALPRFRQPPARFADPRNTVHTFRRSALRARDDLYHGFNV